MNDIQNYIVANLETHKLYKEIFGVSPTAMKQWDDNETCLIDRCAQMLLFWNVHEKEAMNEPSAINKILYISEMRFQLLSKLNKLDPQIRMGILKRYNVLSSDPNEL